jgi:hypothetical protein
VGVGLLMGEERRTGVHAVASCELAGTKRMEKEPESLCYVTLVIR